MNRRRGVLIYSQVPPPRHGSAVMTETLLSVLANLGYETRLLDRRFSHEASEVGRTSLKKVLRVPSLVVRTAIAVARSRNSDLAVFFTTNRPGSMLVDCVVKTVLSLRGVKVVHYTHTFGYQRLAARGRLWSRLIRYLFHGAEAVVTLSERHRADLLQFVGTSPIIICPNATAGFSEPATVAERDRFVYFATISEEKGIRDFLDLASHFDMSGSDCEFDIYGAAADDLMLAAVERAVRDTPRLRYMGEARTQTEKHNALAGATALLYPTHYVYEAQPLAIVEAMALGTPTIAYSRGAIDELINGHNGFVVQDAAELAVAASNLLSDNETRGRMRRRAFEDYERFHSLDAYADFWRRMIG